MIKTIIVCFAIAGLANCFVRRASRCDEAGGSCISSLSSCDGNSLGGILDSYDCGFLKKCCVPHETGPVEAVNTTVAGCGVRSIGGQRIVNGDDAQKGAWPWQIALQLNNRHICGGSVINSRWIVSAAHCFLQSNNPSSYRVMIGGHNRQSSPGKAYSVVKIVRSPKWSGVTGSVLGDIALVKTSSEIDMSFPTSDTTLNETRGSWSEAIGTALSLIQCLIPSMLERCFRRFGSDDVNAVCLPDDDEKDDFHVPNGDCWVTGWGMTNGYVQSLPNVLQEVSAPILTNARCNQNSYGWGGKVKDSQICFATGETSHGACRGDSGGPLVCSRDGVFRLLGIVSWGTPYCNGKPSVFTRVTSYTNWIDEAVQGN